MPDQTPPPSWVPVNTSGGFGLNHLPYGAIRDGGTTQLHVRIGDYAFNLAAAAESGLLHSLTGATQAACRQSTLNEFLSLGPSAWDALRAKLQKLLSADAEEKERAERCLRSLAGTELGLPIEVGDYTDFYASIHHARRVGELFRPDSPLLPNYKHVPIGYHGRASSLIVSGTPVRRPWGQSKPAVAGDPPQFAPSAALDFETELAFVVGMGNRLGEPIPIREAEKNLFGVALLNDWSARDLQSWEYQPLGPFLGKSFATSISGWITPLAALEPFRIPLAGRAGGDPAPLPYLGGSSGQTTFDITFRTSLSPSGKRETQLGQASLTDLYWSPAQMVAHHTSNGCNLRPGDLLATGTISGAEVESAGCLLERTANGTRPLPLPEGSERCWLMDGDEVRLEATCYRPGLPTVRLGSCVGKIEPSPATTRR